MFCSRCGTWAPEDAATCSLCGAALQGDDTAHSTAHAAEGAISRPLALVVPMLAYGGFWRRLAGWLVDQVLLFFPSAIVRVLLGMEPIAWHDPLDGRLAVSVSVDIVLEWMYSALLVSSAARGTLGQQLMDLQVTDGNGARVSFARASARYFATLLTLLTCGVGYLFQLFTSRRQTLHDWVSGTLVVRRSAPPHGVAPASHVNAS